MIIGLTGPARSGKDTVAGYLASNYGFKHFDFYRDVLVREMKRRELEPTKQNASKLGDELRNERGEGVMAELLFPKIDAKDVVITGIRSPAEVRLFRSKSQKFFLILVEASPEKRFERRDPTEPGTYSEFIARDERDFKNKGMAAVFKMADYAINNDGAIGELHENVDRIMKGIAGGRK